MTFNLMKDRYVRYGRGVIPSRWEVLADFVRAELPRVRLIVAIEDERPEIRELTYERDPDDPPFNLTSLRQIPVRALVEMSVAHLLLAGDKVSVGKDGRPFIEVSDDVMPDVIEKAIDLSRRRRRKPTEQEQEAAEIERRLSSGETITEVAEALHISKATVHRRRKLSKGGDRGGSR